MKAGSFAPAAYDAAIRQHGGAGFAAEFDAFAAATAEWQAPNSGFPEGALYPDVHRAGQLSVNGSPGTIALDHTAFALVNVPVTSAPRIRLAVGAPGGTTSALALVGLSDGSLVEAEQKLPSGGHGVVTFANPGNLSRLTAVLVNSDVKHGSFSRTLQDYPFRRDKQRFYAHASTDFTAPRITGRAASAKKVTVTFSEPVLGVSSRSLKLAGASARRKFKAGTRTATLVPRPRALARASPPAAHRRDHGPHAQPPARRRGASPCTERDDAPVRGLVCRALRGAGGDRGGAGRGAVPGAERLGSRWWAAIPVAAIVGTVFGVGAAAESADVLTYLALVTTPPLAAVALGYAARGARPPLALLVVPASLAAWLLRGNLIGEAASLFLVAGACVTLASLLTAVAPARWLKAGLLLMAAADTALVVENLLQPPNAVLNAAAPGGGLPQFQRVEFGSAVMGYGDLFAAALLGRCSRRGGAASSGPRRSPRCSRSRSACCSSWSTPCPPRFLSPRRWSSRRPGTGRGVT